MTSLIAFVAKRRGYYDVIDFALNDVIITAPLSNKRKINRRIQTSTTNRTGLDNIFVIPDIRYKLRRYNLTLTLTIILTYLKLYIEFFIN